LPDEHLPSSDGGDTAGNEYAERLRRHGGARWKRLLDVQRPYRWNLRRLELGRVLDVGCGIGRNLTALGPDSVGVDHNPSAVAMARAAGLTAYTSEEFERLGLPERSFDSMLLAHVLEHMSVDWGLALVEGYLPFIADTVVVICPQELGYRSDPTHVTFLQADDIQRILELTGLQVSRVFSFPLARAFGKVFTYNETVVVARRR